VIREAFPTGFCRDAIFRLANAAAACLVALSTTLHGATFYVAPDGDDAWSGRIEHPNADKTNGPFATPSGARNAVRKLKAQGPLAETVEVIVEAGIYAMKEPLVFEPQDSGTSATPIVYRAAEGTKPVFSGGRTITGFRPDDGPLWVAEIPEAVDGKWPFRQLFINGRRACRARTPNEGYLRVEGLVKTGADPDDVPPPRVGGDSINRFRFKPGDLRNWPDIPETEVVVFHSWNTSRVRIGSVDEKNCVVRLAEFPFFRLMRWDPQQRYYVENTRAALDSPGEWYLDQRAGKLYYWPLPDEDLTKAEAIAPVLHEFVRFDGKPDEGAFVDFVQLVGLTFQHADWDLPAGGYGDAQAAVTVPAVISASGARHCAIERCKVAHIGTYGIWFSRGCKENRIVQNHICDLGAGGVRMGEPNRAETDVAESSGNLVSNNYIHDGGLVYHGAVGIWLAQSSHDTISHNEIHSFDYSGMSIGWTWGYAPNRTHDNRIEYNHIHHVMRGVSSDVAAIYTLGPQPGTVLRNNRLHDIFPYRGSPTMAWGLYFDEGSSEMLVENNIVYHTLTGAIMSACAPGNVVRNNIFAISGWHDVWWWSVPKKDPPPVFERNIFYLTQGDLFHADGGEDDTAAVHDFNLYWRTDGKSLLFYSDDFATWQAKGMDRHGLVADPEFVAPLAGDFSLRPTSPALQLGFQPIDASQIGVQGPSEWVNLPKGAVFSPMTFLAPPEPNRIDDDFESIDEGQPPTTAFAHRDGRGDSIRVSSQTAATGRHSLKFTDAPELAYVFDPFLSYSPNVVTGRATLGFDLRWEQDAIVGHEWRDAALPYRVGPSVRVEADGKLMAGDKHLADFPSQQWVHLEIACTAGKDGDGLYELRVTIPGQQPLMFTKLPCGSADFRRLQEIVYPRTSTVRLLILTADKSMHNIQAPKRYFSVTNNRIQL
jgi:hypothetical protein